MTDQENKKPFTCADKPNPFTQEELKIFEKLLEIKKQKKKHVGDKEKLNQLQKDWEFWKQKSKEAAKQRMVLLGHLEPEEE